MNAEKSSDSIRRLGLMLVMSSPSGAGKSTISRNLIEIDPELRLSVSVTTRPRRGSEIDGAHYHFTSKREFELLRDNDALLEWALVHGNFYATPREPVELVMSQGRDMLFDINWQGAKQLKEKMHGDIVSIFILPPSMSELKARLKRRAEDHDVIIEARLKNACDEIEHWGEYDYVVVNDDLDKAFAEVCAIITAERLRRDRRPGLLDFVSKLVDEKV